jgi:hypothetical protein
VLKADHSSSGNQSGSTTSETKWFPGGSAGKSTTPVENSPTPSSSEPNGELLFWEYMAEGHPPIPVRLGKGVVMRRDPLRAAFVIEVDTSVVTCYNRA